MPLLLILYVLAVSGCFPEELRSWEASHFFLLGCWAPGKNTPFKTTMRQHRQRGDRVRSELDYEVNRRAGADIQGLSRKLNLLGEQISDLEDLIRDKPIASEEGAGANARTPSRALASGEREISPEPSA